MVIELVLDETHFLTDRWQLIVARTVTSVEPLNDNYDRFGAWVQMDVAYWFRGGEVQPTLTLFDPPLLDAGVGFEMSERYMVNRAPRSPS